METIPEDDGLAGEGLGLGLFPHKVARTETFPFRRLHPLSSSSVGPTFYNGSECRSSDLYDVAGRAGAGAGAGARTLQPFSPAFKSPGVGMAASMRFPFTSLQWQELERQTLIYKYMMASLPVPPDLIISICSSRTLSGSTTVLNPHSNLSGSGGFNLRFSNNIDPEPGRCRRTDGKKWRCSRDVAPDQKYCERHMHRGRPRSRKHVEVPAQNQSLPAQIPPPTNQDTTAPLSSNRYQHHQSPGCFPKPESNLSSPAMVSAAIQKEPRYFDTMASNRQWQMLHRNIAMRLSSNAGTSAPVLQPFDHQLKLDFPDFSNAGSATARNDQCSIYLNNLEDPDSDQRQPPKGFIDAWSITSRDDPISNNCESKNSSVLKDMNLPVSSLTLSMPSGGGTTLEDMDQIQMGLGVNDSEGDNGSLKQQQSSWVNSIPWLSSTPLGGPLGEVLQSSAAAGSNSASIYGCNSSKSSRQEGLNLMMTDGWEDGGNPLDGSSRLVSSPSCVLNKTLVSPSDSSGCSSPTFAAEKTENSLQWLCHSKLSS